MKSGTTLIAGGEIILSGPVLLDDYAGWMWEEDVYFCPAMVRQALAAAPSGPLTIRLCSDGGHPQAGEAIRAMIAERDRTQGAVTIVVEGSAMSAATLIMIGASRREMTAGSVLMIHNPSGGAWGEANDLRKEADVLDLLTEVYAEVYAKGTGQSVAAMQAIMAAETWYGPREAIAAGFAHGIAGEEDLPDTLPAPEMIAAAQARMTQSAQRVMARRAGAHVVRGETGPHSEASDLAMTETALTANPKETKMSGIPAAVQPAVPTAGATPPAPVMTAEAAVAAERQRVRAIREMAAPFLESGRVMAADLDALIDQGLTAETAASRLLATMAAREPTLSRSPARITRDEGETRVEGMIGALMGDTSGPAEMFKGLRIKRLAQELAGPSRSFNETETVRRGMASMALMSGGALGVTDFSYITTQVLGRSLLAAYQAAPAKWTAVCGAPISAADFRDIYAVRFGGDFQLRAVQANGEYENASLSDETEGLKVTRFGRTINLTFEAVINDDMGAFQRIPREFAMAARNLESSSVWGLFRNNTALKSDATALFHANHGNLAGSGTVIAATSVAAGRAAMWKQKALGRKSTDDDFISVEPDRLIVPPALEIAALQFVTATTPATDGTVNPYKSSLTPIVVPHLGAAAANGSDTAWYLVSSALPPIQHAYLDGYNAPTVVTVEGRNPDVVTMNARHIFGAAPVDFRGSYKNPGA